MVDLCQWRAAIGLWNCSRVSGVPQRLFRTQEDCGQVPQKDNCTNTDGSATQDNIIHATVSTTGEAATTISWAWSLFSTPETVCFLFYLFLHILLLLSGDVELNPGPTSETKEGRVHAPVMRHRLRFLNFQILSLKLQAVSHDTNCLIMPECTLHYI